MKSLKFIFLVRRGKANRSGLVPVYLRVTINGVRFETAVSRSVPESSWSPLSGRVEGRSKEARELNEFLDSVAGKVYSIQKQMLTLDLPFTKEEFERHWYGLKTEPKMLLGIFRQHNEQVKTLIGSQYSMATWKRYVTSCDHTLHFIQYQYGINDIAVDKIKYEFISDYEFWLKSVRN